MLCILIYTVELDLRLVNLISLLIKIVQNQEYNQLNIPKQEL